MKTQERTAFFSRRILGSVRHRFDGWVQNISRARRKLTIPVLIIQGTNDVQVTVDDAKKLSAADKDAKLVLLTNMNHIFRVVEGDRQANVATYSMPTLPIDPELVTAISNFVNKK